MRLTTTRRGGPADIAIGGHLKASFQWHKATSVTILDKVLTAVVTEGDGGMSPHDMGRGKEAGWFSCYRRRLTTVRYVGGWTRHADMVATKEGAKPVPLSTVYVPQKGRSTHLVLHLGYGSRLGDDGRSVKPHLHCNSVQTVGICPKRPRRTSSRDELLP